LECPICKDFTLGALRTLIQKYVRTGKLRIDTATWRRRRATGNVQDAAGRRAGRGQQNKGWYYIERLQPAGRREQRIRDEQYLRTLAEQRRAEPARLDGGAQRSGIHEHDHQRPHRPPTRPASPARRRSRSARPGPVQKPQYSSLTDPAGFEAADRQLI